MTIKDTFYHDMAVKPSGMVDHLSGAQWAKLAPLMTQHERFTPGTVISRRGDFLDHSLLLLDGLIARSVPRGQRARSTFVALQFPGEFVDLHAFPLKQLDHDVISLTDTHVAIISHEPLRELLNGDVEMARKLWLMTLVDASIHRHWVMRNSAMRALARVANFLSEFDARMTAAHGMERQSLPFSLRQTDIADATGLTSVHVSRTLRELREHGCCAVTGGKLLINDRAGLHKVGQFEPAYLYMPQAEAAL
ncbi:Crp/Fnr family transcriptional regulator [Sulfitobacter sp. KE34]|uniref:Crp/Fnr family transcriptional regulator n=2 Tax=Sulfitobacter TaxID=60136 RepID=A0AAX3LRH0_9RHOB|nr:MULTISPECIES: Crp/Fnr family transcriptional regulator [Sulfitobacter]MDF3351579.1 Crp/Fnr family transcriptional regulator [Sulfitobacter sp. KE12]MDF3355251.1 Crp/Fnr family transcriptional regulator [Sulfitobacter sp. KE27]MDF3358899.1 Crp/Fnr family transcriptional regulator [Sulfitobacter sp. KE33]MDF3362576.1 Crp/Fnr family transcriptional regulator [Sulfitobacter sp. Ks41]MDF3366323.1 Crp/Fnr family transcriptional regulator [Sulfitobacter sp. Ks34]